MTGLEARGLRSGYDGVPVLRGVDLVVPPGRVVALLGPNGAGKTTLLRTLCGLLPATDGTVLVEGRDVTTLPAHQRATLGLGSVPEGRGIFRNLTVRENLRLQARSTSEAEVLEQAVSAFPVLGERLHQVAGTLSGGQQQMLALVRAYVERPRYLLLDEVSMGLAPLVLDEIFAFLSGLAGQGTGLLLVEQYVSRALAMADLVFVMSGGEIQFAGEPTELAEDEIFERYLGQSA
jgi:branched-chain amino acid transport system ATP-binding protein